jgi:hypothetical protein
MPTINGTAVVFGFTGTNGMTITGISGLLTQQADHTLAADREEIRGGQGDHVAHSFYDQHQKGTLEFVVTGTGLGNAITNLTVKTILPPGTIIAVSACASDPDLIQTNWEVQEATVRHSNVGSARISLSVESRAGITAVASA